MGGGWEGGEQVKERGLTGSASLESQSDVTLRDACIHSVC